ncbi:MAG: tRNA dihydrouridine synthase DusB [Candidatus Azobacteroides pseudotrichonymphae]|jgi:nifR3 family TIM-barrel protein|uniref:tRNA-dihydrouridine synthase n=1 Tax=Azobacteroides pseudotrichonymphae genomovar. CFP2 TaxID=511995 RepID=B6YQB2_AZOPC|nr:tRNA dihydrouridine synthase DusB [Candidatus Azobacteroides pseudotrichonymphae]MDR0530296.1 tRNA dihydrouridine synthase DusB [Bacteroidales bacterium OttesenSCG-928-I14]BAG83384.1 tRNA-dihydrouridine synthase [Candidatus Azobacteroides pseudotrichonymphae genomovar. CFP2]GMO35700.1 MAG: tRNA dihydrouridine synthase DusB [Candidatus Azobacteroides pseudotrichonymphae]
MSRYNYSLPFDFQSSSNRLVFLAPMEGVTNVYFRSLCKSFGADMVYTEFISADALIRHVDKIQGKLKIINSEHPIAVQIYGQDKDTMVEAARICEEMQPDFLDLNFGCPVKKIVRRNAGAGMLRVPKKMIEITQQVVHSVNIPITVKTRLGWDENSKIIVDLAERLQDTGIALLTIHGRTGSQMYSGKADWNLIGAVKNNPRMYIPICGNGDIVSPQQCEQAFNRYGVDAVMIGRASIGAPWIFQEVKYYLKYNDLAPKKSFEYYLSVLKQQILQSVSQLGERQGILNSRRHIVASPLFKKMSNFKLTKIAMLQAITVSSLFEIMDNISNWAKSEFGTNC